MKKHVLAICLCLVFAFALAATAMTAQTAPDKDITMSYLPSKTVVFKHAPHVQTLGLACEKCHHNKVDGKIVKCTTAGCHDVFDKKSKSEKALYGAIHGKGEEVESCLTCHKNAAKDMDKAAGKALTGCAKSKCHP
ncbi:MAG: cytochrome c3 family protein [Desulfovibrionaceae bacterium]